MLVADGERVALLLGLVNTLWRLLIKRVLAVDVGTLRTLVRLRSAIEVSQGLVRALLLSHSTWRTDLVLIHMVGHCRFDT